MIANRNGNESLNIFPIKLNFEIKVKYWTLLTTNQRTIQQDQMTSCRWVLANTEAIFTKTKKAKSIQNKFYEHSSAFNYNGILLAITVCSALVNLEKRKC